MPHVVALKSGMKKRERSFFVSVVLAQCVLCSQECLHALEAFFTRIPRHVVAMLVHNGVKSDSLAEQISLQPEFWCCDLVIMRDVLTCFV